jgi:small subunit ribosomal protein S8
MSALTDPIADFLTRIRNAGAAGHEELFAPFSKIKAEIARILQEEGYLWSTRSTPRTSILASS